MSTGNNNNSSGGDDPRARRGRALHDATHGQFGEEPRAGPRPGGEEGAKRGERRGSEERGPAAGRVRKAREQSREA